MSTPTMVADFLTEMLQRAGVEIDDATRAVLQKKELAFILPDDIVEKVREGVVGVKDAANLPEVKTAIMGATLGTAETRFKQSLKASLGMTGEEINTLWGKKNLLDVFPDLIQVVKEKGKKEGEELSGLNADEMRKKITDEIGAKYKTQIEKQTGSIAELQSALERLGQEKESLVSQHQAEFTGFKVRNALGQKISAVKLNPALGSLEGTIRDTIIKKVAESYNWKEENGTLVPYSLDDPSRKAMKGTKVVTVDDIIAENTAEHVAKNPGNGNGRPLPNPPAGGNGNGDPAKPKPRINPYA